MIIFLTFFFVPSVALATNCTSTTISGSSSSSNSGTTTQGSCPGTSNVSCIWSWINNGGSCNFAGVRIQIYKYTGGGPSDAKLVGKGVDLWYNDGCSFTNDYYSSPSTNNLYYKSQCAYNGYTNEYKSKKGYYGIYSLRGDDYFSGKYGNVEKGGNDLKNAFRKGTVNDYLLVTKDGTPTDGWIKNYLLDELIDGSLKSNKFHLSSEDFDNIMSSTGDYYITAEVLFRYKSSGYHGGSGLYYGTVSEGSMNATFDMNNVYNSLHANNQTVGKALIAEKTVSSSLGNLVHFQGLKYTSDCDGKPESNCYKKEGWCAGARGYAIWNIEQICEECGHSCQKNCEQYEKGSFQHQLCAQGYCEVNEKDDIKGCINKCTYVDKDEGCGGECKVVNKTSSSRQCNSSSGKETFETSSCHDDNTTYNVVYKDVGKDLNVNYSSNGKYSYSSLKYYKIDCNEKFQLKDLPSYNANAWLTKTNVGTLHLGFTLDYNKKCNIKYKTGISNSKGNVTYGWQSDFKNSRLENDIKDTKKAIDNSNKAIDDLKKELKEAKTQKKKDLIQESIDSYYNVIEVAEKTFDELIALAPTSFSYNGRKGGGVIDARLIVLTQQDYKSQKTLEPTIDLQYPKVTADYSGSYSVETDHLVLEPVACRETPVTTSKSSTEICAWREDLQKFTTRTTTTYTTNTLLECDNVDANGNATPITATVADSKYSATLSKTLYYELPDTYVLTQSENDGLVFYSQFEDDIKVDFKDAKKQCTDYLNGKEYVLDGKKYALNDKNTTGKCLKRDNLYQYPQFKDKLIVDTITKESVNFKYSIKLNNLGYCGDKLGGYTYNCSYQFNKDTECSKCSQYEKGTSQYESCYEENCSCEAVCNGNVSCKQKYCPTNCESCGTEKTFYSEVECPGTGTECDPTKMDCCNDDCSKKYAAGSDELYMCQYECCSSKTNGNVQGISQCCYNYCNKVSRGNNEKYNECVKTWCDCPECEGGDEYVYRSININDPFNGRENEEDGIGLNWRGKIGYITEENNSKSKQYYDSSNSFTTNGGNPEYTVDLSSGMIKAVKNNRKIGSDKVDTAYQVTKSSKTTKSTINKNNVDDETVDPYCSYLLHDVLETNGNLKQNDTAGMRCK